MHAEALRAAVMDVRSEVREHKTAIRRHREQLGTAAAKLRVLEDECRRRGITFTLHEGAGDIHGRLPRTEN